jgi:hypothetical protein
MKRFMSVLILSLVAPALFANDFTVKAVKGNVEVRRGVSEEWRKLAVGDVLKPEDSMRTGKGASATIESPSRKLTVPEKTIIDISDVRELTQEEFLLKLAMENILAVPPRNNHDVMIPSTTVLRGSDKGKEEAAALPQVETGSMQLHGARVLFENAFYGTSILKSKEVFRIYPSLKADYQARLMVAQAFERLKLTNEAVTEYSLLAKESLTPQQAKQVQSAIERLKRQ